MDYSDRTDEELGLAETAGQHELDHLEEYVAARRAAIDAHFDGGLQPPGRVRDAMRVRALGDVTVHTVRWDAQEKLGEIAAERLARA